MLQPYTELVNGESMLRTVRRLCSACSAAEQASVRTLSTRVTVKEAVAVNTPAEDVSVLVRAVDIPVLCTYHPTHLQGWVKSVRKQKELVFIDVSDGSTPAVLQVVISSDLLKGSEHAN